MLKPPISRMGGKSKLRKIIIEMIPEHICYVELFFGAGWVYFGKEPSKVEVINDIDKEIVNLFKMMKYHEAEISRLLKYEVSARDVFDNYINTDIKSLTDVQRAVRFIFILSQSFASKGKHFGYATTNRPSPQIFETEYLKLVKDRLRNTYIENLSFEKVIDKYDRNHTFFFCDPPYFETDGYGIEFERKEHLLLNTMLKNLKGKFLLTINDHPEVKEWYRGFNIKEVEVNYSVSREQSARGKYKELIITNY
ncbi:DNA adenine methylase [Caloramator quimbayensis]|uniref:DNA adenine methylase n=1 Tax=Caloramator quimbayensis TaxID=1147123 RepID=A0A1T4YDK7_9CLOT|nr:DNA adenine methylase [Caloramator quimbayensis]SKA99834.1 DNA adenine methylase [Caloramator quimbayensis]